MACFWRGVAASLIVASAFAPLAAAATPARLEGTWESPLGLLRLAESDGGFGGRLLEASRSCPGFDSGTEVLRGHLIDGVFTGELRVCLPSNSPCGSGEAWLLTLIALPEGGELLTGAVGEACRSPALKSTSFQLKRAKAPEPRELKEREVREREPPKVARSSPRPRRQTTRPEVRELLDEAVRLIRYNDMENAQRKLMQAEGLDPKNPEVFIQHGISYYIRKNYKMAEHYYQRALAIDPTHMVAHYNLACAVALQGRRLESVKHLRAAVEHGFSDVEALDRDDDLAPIRDHPEFEKIRAAAERRGRSRR